MHLHPEEPEAASWQPVDDATLTATLTATLSDLLATDRPVLLVDGRSGGGKTTFAERAAGRRPPRRGATAR